MSMNRLPVYMDNNATTPLDPRVLAAMAPYLTDKFGNAGSRHHRFGREAHAAVETARAQVANLLNARERDIVFTSGATEANNLVIRGGAGARRNKGAHIVTQVTEHKAVLDPCKRLQRESDRVTFLPVDRHGKVSPEQLAEAVSEQSVLVSVMAANNETGTLQPIEAIGRLCAEKGVPFHTDATQAVGKIPIDVEELGIDFLSLSGHKLYGPQGIGALFVRRTRGRTPLEPLFDGGGQEGGLRPGTLPVAAIVGLGKACELCAEHMADEAARLVRLRDRLYSGIVAALPGVHLNGHVRDRLPGTLNLGFESIEGEALVMALDDVAVSPGSACTSASAGPSYVLTALGLSDALARASLRFSLGRFNTEADVDHAIKAVVRAVTDLRPSGRGPLAAVA
jgi:cysteine desulfurase